LVKSSERERETLEKHSLRTERNRGGSIGVVGKREI